MPSPSTSAARIEVGVAGREDGRRQPVQVQARQLDLVLQDQPRLARHRRGMRHRTHGRTRRKLPEVRVRQRQRRVRVDVARDGQRGVAWVVVAREERAHVVEARRAQVVRASDRQPVVRMVGRVQRVDDGHARHAVGPILVVLPPLVEDDVTLVAELLLGQRGEEVPHPIRFHPQRQLERAGRHDLPVVRPIRVGQSVENRARLLERLEVAVVVVLRPFEHQVLEEVRETCAPGLLVLRAHVVPEVDGHDRAAVILVNEHRQTVPERVLRVRNVHRLPSQRYHVRDSSRSRLPSSVVCLLSSVIALLPPVSPAA